MKFPACCAVALAAGLGCAAPPREKPVLEPPTLAMSGPPPGAGGVAEIVGAWTSVSLKGPGSASYRWIDLILHGDGRCLFAGESAEGVRAFAGSFTWADGLLTIGRPGGKGRRSSSRRAARNFG